MEAKNWSITFKSKTWTNDDATGAHWASMQLLGFGDWEHMTPWHSPSVMCAWLAVLIAGSEPDTGLEQAVVLVASLPASELLGVLAEG